MSGQRMAAPNAMRVSWEIQEQMRKQNKPVRLASPMAYRQPEPEESDDSYSYDYEYSTDGSYYYDEEEGSYSYYSYDESEASADTHDEDEAGEAKNKEKVPETAAPAAAGEAVASDGASEPAAAAAATDAPAAEAAAEAAPAAAEAAPAAEAAAPAAAEAAAAGSGDDAAADADGKIVKPAKLCDHCRKNKRKAIVTMANGRQLKLCEECVRKQIKKAGAPEMEEDMMAALKEAKKGGAGAEPLSPRGKEGPTVGGLTSGKLEGAGTLKRKKHQGRVKLADGPIADVSRIHFASKPKREAPQPPKEALERARKRREEKAAAKAAAKAAKEAEAGGGGE